MPRSIEPAEIVQLIEDYVDEQYRGAEKYSSVELLDESGVYALHTLAAKIYELGFMEGCQAQSIADERAARRFLDHKHEEASADAPVVPEDLSNSPTDAGKPPAAAADGNPCRCTTSTPSNGSAASTAPSTTARGATENADERPSHGPATPA